MRERIGQRSENPLLLKEGCLRALRAGGVVKMICCLKKPPPSAPFLDASRYRYNLLFNESGIDGSVGCPLERGPLAGKAFLRGATAGDEDVLESFAPTGAHAFHAHNPGRCPGLDSAAAPRLSWDGV
jgi:hypothetical protein